jgi:dTDP-4-dehydrorhamnose 3,5-epimerase
METLDLPLAGATLIRPRVFRDNRGYFVETYSEPRYAALGLDVHFVQDNHSRSARNALRGLHYQSAPGQAKLLRVASGRVYDVIVDIRPKSPTFGQWHGLYLDGEAHEQLFVPVGFAHGFCVVSEFADVLYKVSSPYDAKTECALRWNDPEIGVNWPVADPILSARDQSSESFADFKARVSAQAQ